MSSANVEPTFEHAHSQPEPRLGLKELKELFAEHLRTTDGAENDTRGLKHHEGIATGLEPIDRFLFWRGFPKGALSLLHGEFGSGLTSMWLGSAANILKSGRSVVWVNGEAPLSPLSLYHRGFDLSRFIAIDTPESTKKLFWLLQELMASSLFDLIGCELGSLFLREHQVRKLQAQARQAKVALVFLSRKAAPRGSVASVYSLIIGFEKRRVVVERALHRPTPHSFPRSVHYARFTLHTGDRIGLGTDLLSPREDEFQSSSLPEVTRAAGAGF